MPARAWNFCRKLAVVTVAPLFAAPLPDLDWDALPRWQRHGAIEKLLSCPLPAQIRMGR